MNATAKAAQDVVETFHTRKGRRTTVAKRIADMVMKGMAQSGKLASEGKARQRRVATKHTARSGRMVDKLRGK